MDKIETIIILIKKPKNRKLDLKGKIESNKNFNKMTKKKERERDSKQKDRIETYCIYKLETKD